MTDKGRKRLEKKELVPVPSAVTFVELYEDYEASFRSQLLDKLSELLHINLDFSHENCFRLMVLLKSKLHIFHRMEASMGMESFD